MLEDYLAYYDGIDRIIVGGNTYSSMAGYWQHAEESSPSALERSIAKKLNDIPKTVISRSAKELVWRNSEAYLFRDVSSFVQDMETLKNGAGNVSVDSGIKTWQLFIGHGLFDELWVFVHPVVAGLGVKLFEPADKPLPLRLTDSKVYRNGVIGLHYRTSQP